MPTNEGSRPAKAPDKAATQAAPKARAGGKTGKKAEAEAAAEATDLPRVLVLTGTGGSEKIIRMQLARLFKAARGKVELVVYEGEKDVSTSGPSAEAIRILGDFFKGSPMKMYDELCFDERQWRCYKEVRGTLETIQAAMKERAPIHGVLGFSQGANFAVMLAAQSYFGVGMPLSFVVALCPNAPGYVDQVRDLFLVPLETPAFISRGEEEKYDAGLEKFMQGKEIDTLGEPVVSEHVVKLFREAEVFTHPNGHQPLPAKPKDQDALIDKVMDFMLRKSSKPPIVRKPEEPVRLPFWRVPDGSGGRVVRWGVGLDSTELSDSLRPGALVEEIELQGTRLHYHLVTGIGPPVGWVTTRSTKGQLLMRAPDNAAGTTGEIWIVTVGTRGDLQPFVVLGMALRDAGYQVRLFGPPELSSFEGSGISVTIICRGWSDRSQAGLQVGRPQRAGPEGEEGEAAGDGVAVGAAPIDPELEAALRESERPLAEGAIPGVHEPEGGWGPFLGLLWRLGVDTNNGGDVVNLAWLWNEMPKAIQSMMGAMDAGKPDLLIYNHLMVNMGLLMWRLYGVRSIFANLGLEFHFAPRGEDSFNYNTLGAFDRIVSKRLTGVAPMVDVDREQFRNLYNSKDRLLGTTKLIIYALPRVDQLAAKEWKFTGFWIYDEQKQKEEQAADAFGGPEVMQKLSDFLLDGDPPVYLGWGSMPTLPGLILILVQALMNLKLRAVMVRGWGNLSIEALEEAAAASAPERSEELCAYASQHVLFVDKAPHEWLLQRCTCSVHHGGAGTTAAAMRAGVPTIVVPLGYDQPVHGEWVQRLGVGIKAAKMSEIQAEEFEAALHKATTDLEMRSKARQVADTLRKEPGVSAAVEKVRKIMREDVRTGKAQARWEAEREERKSRRKRDTFWEDVDAELKRKTEEAREAKRQREEEMRQQEEQGEIRREGAPRSRSKEDLVVDGAAATGTESPAWAAPSIKEAPGYAPEPLAPPEPPQEPRPRQPPLTQSGQPLELPEMSGPPTPSSKAQEEPRTELPPVSPAAEEPAGPPVEQPAELAAPMEVIDPSAEDPVNGPAQLARSQAIGAAAEVSDESWGAPAPGIEERSLKDVTNLKEDKISLVAQNGMVKEDNFRAISNVLVETESAFPNQVEEGGMQRRDTEQQHGKEKLLTEERAGEETRPTVPRELVIYIDRNLDLKTTMCLRPGAVVKEVKELLAADDPTGETAPQDFSLLDPATGAELGDTTLVSGVFAELEISVAGV